MPGRGTQGAGIDRSTRSRPAPQDGRSHSCSPQVGAFSCDKELHASRALWLRAGEGRPMFASADVERDGVILAAHPLPPYGQAAIAGGHDHEARASCTPDYLLTAMGCGLGSADAGRPITSTDGETPGVRLDVQEFKRVSGGAAMLRFTVVNGSESNLSLSGGYLGPSYGTVDGTYLVDLAGKKKYEVLRDADKNCICSRNLDAVKAGQSINLWAKFPAPPDNVDKVGIVVQHFIPMDDVPLAR